MRELEENNQDLIDTDEEMDEVNHGRLTFQWDHKLHKYKIEG